MRLRVYSLTGESAVTKEDGQNLYSSVQGVVTTDEPIELDFEGIRVFATPFFNNSIGRLIRTYGPAILEGRIQISNLSAIGQSALERVKQAGNFPSDSEEIPDAIKKALSEE